jgi:hypothetical protein
VFRGEMNGLLSTLWRVGCVVKMVLGRNESWVDRKLSRSRLRFGFEASKDNFLLELFIVIF